MAKQERDEVGERHFSGEAGERSFCGEAGERPFSGEAGERSFSGEAGEDNVGVRSLGGEKLLNENEGELGLLNNDAGGGGLSRDKEQGEGGLAEVMSVDTL